MNQTLDRLSIGAIAEIVEIEGEDAIALRLAEMGLLEGERIRVHAISPLGDPVEYEVRGYRLSLRKSEARRIIVRQL